MAHQYQIGDRLRIREWGDMVAEFGEIVGSHILTPTPFNIRMRPLCGMLFTVSSIESARYRSEEGVEFIDAFPDLNHCGYWAISADMLEPDTSIDLPEVTDIDFDNLIRGGIT